MTKMSGGGRRYLVVLAVVAGWIGTGIAFRLSSSAYQLLGVPLLLAFQLGIARRPIAELWFKAPSRAPLPWWGWLVAAAFAATPCFYLLHIGWGTRAWMLCAMAGAVPLAYSVARLSRSTVRPLLLCFATAGALSVVIMVGNAWLNHHGAAASPAPPLSRSPWVVGARSLFLYFPSMFVMEEVFFRGGLDSYLDQPGMGHPWLSATFISILWGLWHLPSVLERIPLLPHAVANPVVVFTILLGGLLGLPLMYMVSGIPFSLCWRRSGLLFVPALVHAFIDAVRNGLIMWH